MFGMYYLVLSNEVFTRTEKKGRTHGCYNQPVMRNMIHSLFCKSLLAKGIPSQQASEILWPNKDIKHFLSQEFRSTLEVWDSQP